MIYHVDKANYFKHIQRHSKPWNISSRLYIKNCKQYV